MRALINAKNTNSVVCRVAKDSLAKSLLNNSYEVEYDNNNYQKYDLIIFFSSESRVDDARKINPKAVIGILDPKLNNEKQYQEARKSDFLVVSSLEQQLFASRYNKNIIIYNWFSEIKLINSKRESTNKLRIAYQGNKIHLNAFKHSLKYALEDLYEEFNFIELVAIYDIKNLGKWKTGRPKIPIVDIQWNEYDYCEILSSCDIGIVPNLLPINKFLSHSLTQISLRKSKYNYTSNDYLIRFKLNSNPNRFWEFSQLKIPVVADLFPSSLQVIDHQKNGYLAFDKNTWFQSLKKLIQDPKLRDFLGLKLFETFNGKFSIRTNQQRFIEFLFENFQDLRPK